MGIFLDVPTEILESELLKWRNRTALTPSSIPGAPTCGLVFWSNAPHLQLSVSEEENFAGTYVATTSPNFSPKATVTKSATAADEYFLKQGATNATFFFVSRDQESGVLYFKVYANENGDPLVGGFAAIQSPTDLSFTLFLGLSYQKE